MILLIGFALRDGEDGESEPEEPSNSTRFQFRFRVSTRVRHAHPSKSGRPRQPVRAFAWARTKTGTETRCGPDTSRVRIARPPMPVLRREAQRPASRGELAADHDGRLGEPGNRVQPRAPTLPRHQCEFGRLTTERRKQVRGSSIAGTALSVHGLIAVADALFRYGIDPATVLPKLNDTVEVDGAEVDYFSYDNPLWLRIGVLALAESKDGTQRKQLRVSFPSRRAMAAELKRKLGVAGEAPAR
jgi:hypothetical protein